MSSIDDSLKSRSEILGVKMACGDIQQVRFGEMMVFQWDSSGALTSDPLGENGVIDLGGRNVVSVSVTPCSLDLGTGVTSIDFEFLTAPINSRGFYAKVKSGGSTLVASVANTNPTFVVGEGFSRFFALATPETLSGATSQTTLTATIDVVVRN